MLRRQPGRRTRTHDRDLPLQPHGPPPSHRRIVIDFQGLVGRDCFGPSLAIYAPGEVGGPPFSGGHASWRGPMKRSAFVLITLVLVSVVSSFSSPRSAAAADVTLYEV